MLSKLIDAGALERVQHWYGCSGGSFCAFFGALGVSAAWIRDAVEHFDTRAIARLEDDLISDYLNTWGVNSGNKLIEFLGRFVDTWEPGASAWTFADFGSKRPGVTLKITASNVTRGSLAVFSEATTPHIRILDAIRASIAVPGFFTPWIDPDGDLFCDGAILEYFPWGCVEDKANTLVLMCSETGISGRKISPTKVQSLSEYFRQIVRLVQQNQASGTPKNWIAITNKHISGLDFHMSKDERLGLFSDGVIAAGRWLAFRSERSKLVPAGETGEIRQQCGDHCTLSCSPPSPDRTSDSPRLRIPPPTPCQSRDLHSGGQRPGRRWSL